MAADVRLQTVEGLLAEVMLDLAGIAGCGLGIHPQGDEHGGQHLMALKNTLGDFGALGGQRNITVCIGGNIAVFPQFFHSHADAGLFIVQFIDDINGSDHAETLLQNQDDFQVVFGRLVNDQENPSKDGNSLAKHTIYRFVWQVGATSGRPRAADSRPCKSCCAVCVRFRFIKWIMTSGAFLHGLKTQSLQYYIFARGCKKVYRHIHMPQRS